MTSRADGGRFSCVADHHARMPTYIIITMIIYNMRNNDGWNKKRINVRRRRFDRIGKWGEKN